MGRSKECLHNCRQMLLAEIADCHATMLRQGEKVIRLEQALNRIVAAAESDVLVCEPTVFDIAREALADRP